MAEDQTYSDEELKLLAQLGEAALADPRPRLTPEEVRGSLKALYEQAVRERRKRA